MLIKDNTSFAGMPFPIESAQEHFRKIKKEGNDSLKLVVTWAEIEHEGQGIYDEAYLAYLRKILLIAEKEGVSISIAPHQDLWSNWAENSGVPAWTMEKLGIKIDTPCSCGAGSILERYVTSTMFSLFFAGNIYAPDLQIENENIQDLLQNHYVNAFKHAKRRLKNCAAVTSWGSPSEAHCGFIGHKNLENTENFFSQSEPCISPWQTICAASGYSCKTFAPEGVSLFKDGFSCPWKQAGVWREESGAPRLMCPNHFGKYLERTVNFADDFFKPFIAKYNCAMDSR
jgi:hypothetical protein